MVLLAGFLTLGVTANARADPTAQLDELADLVDRGLLSAEEMQFQRGKVVDA